MSGQFPRGALLPLTAVAAVTAATVTAASGAALATSAATAGTDPVRAGEWWLAAAHATQIPAAARGAGITVAVLSTGVGTSHQDLAGSVITGPDYTGSGRFPGGPFWGTEGTAVAGVIAGRGHGPGDAAGIIGIAPGARILSVRVTLEYNDPLNSDTTITGRLTGAIAQGIRFAADHGAKVIDLPLDPGSLAVTGTVDRAAAGGSAAESAAVRYAIGKGAVLVAPAGDDGEGPGLVNFPAAYPGVIAVGAVAKNSALAAFSSRRSYVSLTAPGAAMVAAAPPDSYSMISTTDLASAIVAGTAALIRSRFPLLTASQVTRTLIQSTGHSQRASGSGYGTVNAARAVQAAAVLVSSTKSTSSGGSGMSKPRHARTTQPRRAKTTVAAARRPAAAGLAGSVLKDAAIGTAVLMILLFSVILTARAKRQRRRAARLARSAAGGGATHRAAGAGSRRLAELRGHGVPALAQALGTPPWRSTATGSATSNRSYAGSGSPASAGVAGNAIPANGGSLAGSNGLPTRASVKPLLAPVPKLATSNSASRQPGGPPWDVASMPGTEPGNGLRPAPEPAAAARPPWELASPSGQKEPGPAARAPWGPAASEPDGVPRLQTPVPREVPRLPRRQPIEPGIGYAAAPVPADITDPRTSDAPTSQSLGAPQGSGAPQDTGMPGGAMPGVGVEGADPQSNGPFGTGPQSGGMPGMSSPGTGSMYVWNPAASTEVFPAIRLDANGDPIPPDEGQPDTPASW